MSPLSNQPQSDALEVLIDLVRSFDHRLAEKNAHRLGLDVKILAAMYEADVKPYLDFILGYEDLSELDPLRSSHRPVHGEAGWIDVLGRYGIVAKYPQVAQVLHAKLLTAEQDVELQLAVFLSCKGKWIVWHKRYSNLRQEVSEREYIAVFDTVQDMFELLNQLVTDDFTFNFQLGHDLPRYAPLRIARGLLELLQSTIEKRQAYLASFQSAYDEGRKRLSLIDFKGQ